MSQATWAVALLTVLCVGLSKAADFADNTGGFDFIYHENHNLILTVYNETCYYASVPDGEKSLMTSNGKTALEEHIKRYIIEMDKARVHPSSLQQMRDTYKDRLADYHCTNNDVYTLQMLFPETVTCTFESTTEPFCGFTQDLTDDFSWLRHTGHTPSVSTGPDADHTYGHGQASEGHYVYIEASNPRRPNEKARLILPVISLTGRCLQFYYNMHGAGIGTLNVYATNQTSLSHLPPPFWSLSGNQGTGWKEGRVSIPMTTDFDLIFEGVLGPSTKGDIAIDDIILSDGVCSGNSTATPTSAPVTVRLTGGTFTSGRLEILYNGQWGTVCDDYFGSPEAHVACRMLGLSGGSLAQHSHTGNGWHSHDHHDYHHTSNETIMLDDVDCHGDEATLWDCRHNRVGSNDCDHSEDVHISCESSSTTSTSSSSNVRLVGGTATAGRLEVYQNGQWGAVCRNDFGSNELHVACNTLGLTSGEPTILSPSTYTSGAENILWQDVHCHSGQEGDLFQCNHALSHRDSCDTVAISCGSRCHNIRGHWYADGATVHMWYNHCDSMCTCKNGLFHCDSIHACPDESQNLPASCTMEHQREQCCPVKVCS